MNLDKFCGNFLNVEALPNGNDILKNRDQTPFLTIGVLKKVFFVEIYSNDSLVLAHKFSVFLLSLILCVKL